MIAIRVDSGPFHQFQADQLRCLSSQRAANAIPHSEVGHLRNSHRRKQCPNLLPEFKTIIRDIVPGFDVGTRVTTTRCPARLHVAVFRE